MSIKILKKGRCKSLSGRSELTCEFIVCVLALSSFNAIRGCCDFCGAYQALGRSLGVQVLTVWDRCLQ